ncbi:antibiotic biosynthesis monooxygenase family protein [Stappia sp.]|uniref:antibiotic biosynthesis monooxygenase family protein n=1 Tax=Stappia sp. TaxID=1870903 RepID=UPI003D0EA60A
MIAVIFEVWPKDGHKEPYLDIAAGLKPLLAEQDGFISVERFESLTEPGKLLSVSFWRDEEALAKWRHEAEHRIAQAAGRGKHFANYRLRVAGVIRDYGMDQRDEAPEDSIALHG